MEEFTLRVATPADAPALAEAANQYTFQTLDETERQNGFLTGSFSVPTVQAMLASVPGQVAYAGQNLAGFVLNSKLPPELYPPLVKQISQLVPSLMYRHRPLAQYQWFFYGPVLVTKQYRGQGLVARLFAANKQELQSYFEVGIAFIAEQNASSLRVHTQRLGLEVVGSLVFQGVNYALLVFPLT